jgi:LacI family transcriptional regulator
MSATINDVARLAGVSRSTVSLVLRGGTRVAEETRVRVREAMERLGYRPSHFAAGLRSRRSQIVGLVVSSLTFPHHAHIALGVEQAIEAHGYSVLVANSRQSVERERDHIDRLRRYHADGVVITPLQIGPHEAQHLVALRAEGFPVVTAYREIPGLAVDFVGVDARASVCQAASHLADLGHRRIAFLVGSDSSPVNRLRVAGWRDALHARGLDADPGLVVSRTAGPYTGESATAALLASGVPFTAVVGANDFFALGALRALYRAGKRVPQDVSVAGIGGFDPAMSPERRLTTVAHDFESIGRRAGELLLRRMTHPRHQEVERQLVPAELRLGETTACPP